MPHRVICGAGVAAHDTGFGVQVKYKVVTEMDVVAG
jgi:hypothetical protein